MRLGARFFLPCCFLLGLVLTIGMAGCNPSTAPKTVDSTVPLVSVEAIAPPPKLPDWIDAISPIGDTQSQAQIRVRFKQPLIPVETLESQNQQDLLQKFELTPPLNGKFRFLTPRMVGFQADQAIPPATRVRVTLKSGLADLQNHRLDRDLAWTFQTSPIQITELPTSYSSDSPKLATQPIEPRPNLTLTSNVELNPASLKEHTRLIPDGKTDSVSVAVELAKSPEVSTYDSPDPETTFDASQQTWQYHLKPEKDLALATPYALEISPGVQPKTGNLPTTTPYNSRVATYSPLAYSGDLRYTGQPDSGGNYGRFSKGVALIEFNNPLDVESVKANLSISPQPNRTDIPWVRHYEGDRSLTLNPWALEPATSYMITVNGKLKDSFGQTLGKDLTIDYSTGDSAPDLWAPSNLNIFPVASVSQSALQLNVSTVNLSSFRFATDPVQPTDLVYIDAAYPSPDRDAILPALSNWQTQAVQNRKNEAVDTAIPVQKLLGKPTGMLAYAVQSTIGSRDASYYGLVQLTNLGVFAQWFPDSGLVRVHRLNDGAPVANAEVQVYVSKVTEKQRPQPTPCATGRTNAAGLLSLAGEPLRACRNPKSDTPPTLLTVAQVGQDWAYTRTTEYSGAYDYGIDAGWESGKPVSRGTIFSDRQLYQPGETAYFTGAAYMLQGGNLRQDQNVRYKLTLESPNGKKTDLGNQTTNSFGTFALELPIAKTQPLGYYTVRAKSDSGAEISGEFRIAEFKPPNFKVALTLEGGEKPSQPLPSLPGQGAIAAISKPKQTLTAQAQSNYLFGAPVQNGQVQYYVTRQQADFTPPGQTEYRFGRQWFWPEEPPELSSDVLQQTQTLNAEGQSRQTVTIGEELPYPMSYRIDAQVSDVSNLSVADSQTVLALPSDRLIGLKTDFVAEAGQEFPVQVVVSDPMGKRLSGERVKLELQQMNYSSIARIVEGSSTAQDQVEYKTVTTTEVKSQAEPQIANLKIPDSGSYRIRAVFADRPTDEAAATDVQLWATGKEPAYWGDRYSNNRLELKLDKSSYNVGDTATALIQSPYDNAELYFAVVRHDVMYQTVTKVSSSAPKIQFQVTPDMLPNAAIEAILVRQGQPLEQLKADQPETGSLKKLVKIGFAPFQVNLDDRYAQVEILPAIGTDAAKPAQPGEEQTVELRLKDRNNQPIAGQFTVMVVNEAVLQLSGYRPPDLVKLVFAEQPISVRLSDNRPDVVLQPMGSPLQKGWGYGGGLSAGAENTRTRTDFRPVAYYRGAVNTDANGKARVSFKLPDDLTTWRVMAVAIAQTPAEAKPSIPAQTWRFGQGDATFMVSKALVSNPILPQFARPGDRFQLGAAVTNNTGQKGDLTLNTTLQGNLSFESDSGLSSRRTQSMFVDPGSKGYRYPVVVGPAGTAKLQIQSQLNSASDAFEVPLEIKPLTVTEQVIESGATNREATIPLNIEANAAKDVGGLEVVLSSSLVPQLAAPAQQVLDQQDLPFLEPAASQLMVAANLSRLSQTYGQTVTKFDPTAQAAQAIAQLQSLQREDGGFASYPKADQSDPFLTPYAATAISQATAANLTPGLTPQLTQSLRTYLAKLLANPAQYDYCKNAACKNQVRLETLIALASLGDKRTEFLPEIVAQRDQLDPIQQFRLAQYLTPWPEWQAEAKAIANSLNQTTYETGRSARVNLPQGWRWVSSAPATQAEAVKLALIQKQSPEAIAKRVQGLLDQRRDGTWQTTYDNAAALSALVAVSQQQPTPPQFSATADLNGKSIATANFQGYQSSRRSSTVAPADLPSGKTTLNLKKSGNGILHYLVAYRYRLQGEQPGRLNGLRVTRTIRPANQSDALQVTGLTPPAPLKLPAGQVYDVGLEIIADHPVDQVVITDPLPAGFEPVDQSFKASTPYFQAKGDNWQLSYQTMYRDRVVAFGDKLNPGVYTLHYLVRSVTPGTFLYPAAEAHLQYAPEEFGRTATSQLIVEEKQ
jgi:alpha-2-macroglobulin